MSKPKKGQIGNTMHDGTVYAGISPSTKAPMYTIPKPISGKYLWNDAMKYAEDMKVHGHSDWRLPTEEELLFLLENRGEGHLRSVFGQTSLNGSDIYYWSSTCIGKDFAFTGSPLAGRIPVEGTYQSIFARLCLCPVRTSTPLPLNKCQFT